MLDYTDDMAWKLFVLCKCLYTACVSIPQIIIGIPTICQLYSAKMQTSFLSMSNGHEMGRFNPSLGMFHIYNNIHWDIEFNIFNRFHIINLLAPIRLLHNYSSSPPLSPTKTPSQFSSSVMDYVKLQFPLICRNLQKKMTPTHLAVRRTFTSLRASSLQRSVIALPCHCKMSQ